MLAARAAALAGGQRAQRRGVHGVSISLRVGFLASTFRTRQSTQRRGVLGVSVIRARVPGRPQALARRPSGRAGAAQTGACGPRRLLQSLGRARAGRLWWGAPLPPASPPGCACMHAWGSLRQTIHMP